MNLLLGNTISVQTWQQHGMKKKPRGTTVLSYTWYFWESNFINGFMFDPNCQLGNIARFQMVGDSTHTYLICIFPQAIVRVRWPHAISEGTYRSLFSLLSSFFTGQNVNWPSVPPTLFPCPLTVQFLITYSTRTGWWKVWEQLYKCT